MTRRNNSNPNQPRLFDGPQPLDHLLELTVRRLVDNNPNVTEAQRKLVLDAVEGVEPTGKEIIADRVKQELYPTLSTEELNKKMESAFRIILDSPDDDLYPAGREKSFFETQAEEDIEFIRSIFESRKDTPEQKIIDESKKDSFMDWKSKHNSVWINAIRAGLEDKTLTEEAKMKMVKDGLSELGEYRLTSVSEINAKLLEIKHLLQGYRGKDVRVGSRDEEFINAALDYARDLKANREYLTQEELDKADPVSSIEKLDTVYNTRGELKELLKDNNFDNLVFELFTPEQIKSLIKNVVNVNMAWGRSKANIRKYGDNFEVSERNIGELRAKIYRRFNTVYNSRGYKGDYKVAAEQFLTDFLSEYAGRKLGGRHNSSFDDMQTNVDKIEHLRYSKRQRLASRVKKAIEKNN